MPKMKTTMSRTVKMSNASKYVGDRDMGDGGSIRNSRHVRNVAKTPGGTVQKGRMSPKGTRN